MVYILSYFSWTDGIRPLFPPLKISSFSFPCLFQYIGSRKKLSNAFSVSHSHTRVGWIQFSQVQTENKNSPKYILNICRLEEICRKKMFFFQVHTSNWLFVDNGDGGIALLSRRRRRKKPYKTIHLCYTFLNLEFSSFSTLFK